MKQYWIYLALTLLPACGHSPSKQEQRSSAFDGMAKAICNCYTGSRQEYWNNKLRAMQESGDTTGLDVVFDELERSNEEIRACMQQVETEFGKTDEAEEEQQIREALIRNCPSMAALLKLSEQ